MPTALLALVREAVLLGLTVSAPPLAAALVVGLGTGALQAATQIQEPSAPVVVRLAAVLGALGMAGPWMGARLTRFAAACLDLAAQVGS